MSADAHASQGTETMTRIAIIAALALNVSVASGFAQFNPDLARTLVPTVPNQDVAGDLGGDRDVGQMLASHKVR